MLVFTIVFSLLFMAIVVWNFKLKDENEGLKHKNEDLLSEIESYKKTIENLNAEDISIGKAIGGKKEYKEIKFMGGQDIESALAELKASGDLTYGMFNGVILYSDVDDINSAYKKITGLTKEQFEEKYRLKYVQCRLV